MKNLLSLALIITALFTTQALAADRQVWVPLKEVVQMGIDGGQLSGQISFHMKGNSPSVEKKMGTDMSNKKTNAFNKTDEEACRWVVLSTLVSFEQSAIQRGANAIVDIYSYYRKNTKEDPNNIECYAGTFVAGATIRGAYAKK